MCRAIPVCRKKTMALLRRCLLELRARQGDYDSHQQLDCGSSFDFFSDATLVDESDTGSASSSDPDLATRRRQRSRTMSTNLIGALH
jgi:hypothetical protein